ncbi:glutaredoxin family protein [Undibacterium sp.]|jgi:glutaredoxin-like protein NrdH|uniref:glutaredoxin family protein n=1 Tax=Undibacterium sp. TaxID=1914977 RepID=UPI002C73B17D|nr:glutaredoxin family protein [Undibacterium sp.]HTD05972.1 glutaredoxin family protein [Undibacterium sp.]
MQAQYRKYLKEGFLLIAVAALAIVLGSKAPHWYRLWQGPFKNGDYSTHIKSSPYKLTLYGTSTCQHCQSARAYLRQAGVPFNDSIIDQSSEAAKLYQQLGEQAVPVLVSENKIFVGFNPARYAEMVKISGAK